jgi:hypothetical protein
MVDDCGIALGRADAGRIQYFHQRQVGRQHHGHRSGRLHLGAQGWQGGGGFPQPPSFPSGLNGELRHGVSLQPQTSRVAAAENRQGRPAGPAIQDRGAREKKNGSHVCAARRKICLPDFA